MREREGGGEQGIALSCQTREEMPFTLQQVHVNHMTGAHMVVDLLQRVVCEGCQGSGASVPHSDGVVDALEYTKLPQVNLWRLRLTRKREGERVGRYNHI